MDLPGSFLIEAALAELLAKVLNVCFWQIQSSRFCSSPDALLSGGEDKSLARGHRRRCLLMTQSGPCTGRGV